MSCALEPQLLMPVYLQFCCSTCLAGRTVADVAQAVIRAAQPKSTKRKRADEALSLLVGWLVGHCCRHGLVVKLLQLLLIMLRC